RRWLRGTGRGDAVLRVRRVPGVRGRHPRRAGDDAVVSAAATFTEVVADLAAEYADLDAIVGGLGDAQWGLPTPAAGWTVGDQVRHLAFSDGRAREAVADPEAFEAAKGADVGGVVDRSVEAGRSMMRQDVPAWWRDERASLLGLLERADPSRRVPWYGPPMGM